MTDVQAPILSKKDFSDVQISSEISRLTELKRRK